MCRLLAGLIGEDVRLEENNEQCLLSWDLSYVPTYLVESDLCPGLDR